MPMFVYRVSNRKPFPMLLSKLTGLGMLLCSLSGCFCWLNNPASLCFDSRSSYLDFKADLLNDFDLLLLDEVCYSALSIPDDRNVYEVHASNGCNVYRTEDLPSFDSWDVKEAYTEEQFFAVEDAYFYFYVHAIHTKSLYAEEGFVLEMDGDSLWVSIAGEPFLHLGSNNAKGSDRLGDYAYLADYLNEARENDYL